MSIDRIRNEFNNNKCFLLCDIEISNDDYCELINYTQKRIDKIDATIPPREDVLLSITLVQIAIREYKEGNYWGYFEKLFTNLTSSKKDYINQLFINTLSKNDLFILENLNDRTQYVENIKAHSFVPNNYLNSYFDFLYSFYEGNLLRNIPDDLTDDLESLRQFMLQSLSISGDIIKLENSATKKAKTYKLLKATRRLFSSAPISIIEEKMLQHLHMLDDYYYDGIIPSSKDRFSMSFDKWTSDFNNNDFEKVQNRTARKRGPISHKPYFKILNEKPFLVIPPQKFRDNEFSEKAVLSINGVINDTLDIFNSFGIKVSEEKSLLFENIFDDYSIQISSLKSKQYHIPKCNYRIFDENWESVSSPRRGINFFLLQKGKKIQKNKNAIISTPFPTHKDWDIYQIEFSDESSLYIGSDRISISKEFIGITDTEQFSSHKYFLEDFNGNKIHTFYRHITISFVIQKENVKKTVLHCNEYTFKNIDIPGTTEFVKINENPKLVGVEINLDNLLVREDGEYSIWIDEPGKPNTEIIKYLLLTNLRCKPEWSLYYFQETAKIIANGTYKIFPINCKHTDTDNAYIFEFENGNKTAKFNITVSNNVYILNVPLNAVEYNINGDWLATRPKYIWFKDLPNLIYIRFPYTFSCNLFIKSYPQKMVVGKLKNGIYEFDITELKEFCLLSDYDRYTLMIEYKNHKGTKSKSLFNILKALWFHKFEFYNSNGNFCINAEFEGNAKCYVNIKAQFTKESLKNNFEISNGENILPNIPIDEVYEIERICIEVDKFGFESIELSKFVYRYIYIGEPQLEKSNINIDDVVCNGEKLELHFSYEIKNIKNFDDEYFTGTLYETQKSKSKSFKPRMFSEKIIFKICDDNNDNITMNFEKDSLPFYDNKLKQIVSEKTIENSVDYDRYLPLFDNETVFAIKIRRFE